MQLGIRVLRIGLLFTIAACFGVVTSQPGCAQEDGGGWSPPKMIAEANGGLGNSIAVASDQSGTVHVFTVSRPEANAPIGIDHMSWNNGHWSEPVTIVVQQDSDQLYAIRAVIDARQNIHLIWHHGDGSHRHALAPLAQADDARAWSTPTPIVQALAEADILATPDGTLFVAFADPPPNATISIVRSADGGATWSMPETVAQVNQPGTAANEVRLAVDGAGRIHIAWTEYELPNGWPPTGAFYTRSLDGGRSWEQPIRVAQPSHGQIGVSTSGKDEVHLVWRSTIGGDGTFHQVSRDGGKTWSNPDHFDDRGGFSGLPGFAVDSEGGTHYVLGSVMYTNWNGSGLDPYVDVATAELRNSPLAGDSVERGQIAITTGNTVHVIWESGFQRLWYSMRRLGVRARATVMLPTTPPMAAVKSTSTAAPRFTPAPVATSAALVPPPPPDTGTQGLSIPISVALGTIPAVLLVAVIVVAVRFGHR